MQNQNHKTHHFLPLLILLAPPYVTAQESFGGNYGEPFTPSTIIIVIMAIIFILTAFLAIFLRQFSQGCFGLNTVPANPNVTIDGLPVARGLDAEVIKSLPTYFYSDVKQHRKGKVELECAVCLNEFLDNEALRLLPGCSHVFHPRCIDRWLVSHVTCPICRQTLEPKASNTKEHMIINLPFIQGIESDGQDNNMQVDDIHGINDENNYEADNDTKRSKIVGKFPRSHSTGHSVAYNSDRFRLVLPDDVQNTIVNRFSPVESALTSMVSPRRGYTCGWFSMTPPAIISTRSGLVWSQSQAGGVVPGWKKSVVPPVKTSERLWPI